jgi:hypothetical protein
MYDILSNHKVVNVKTHATQTVGTAATSAKDLMAVADKGLRERNTRGLLLIFVTAVNTTGDITITIQTSKDNSTWDNDFAVLTNIAAIGVYIADVKYLSRYVRLSSVCADANVDWGALFVTFDAERRPVKQADATALTVDYAANIDLMP